MFLGPVFQAEAMRTSRRGRYYFARMVYGLALLALIGWTYEGIRRSSTASSGAINRFDYLAQAASEIFWTFISTQVGAVIFLTPAMVAGTVADEKQRKTLHYLLASRLTSLEIVVGKLAARLLQVGILILVGLPIISILTLFGGLDPPLVLLAFLGTFSTAYCLGGLSIYVSTVSRRARDAIVMTYLLAAVSFSLPMLYRQFSGPTVGRAGRWIEAIADPIVRLDPFQLTRLINPSAGLMFDLGEMILLQTLVGTLFVGLAVWRLRPAYAGEKRSRDDSGRSKTRGIAAALRLWKHPRIADDPILWKEMHVARTAPMLRLSGFLLGIFGVVFLGDALLDLSRPAFAELAKFGYGDAVSGVIHRARDEMNDFVSNTGALIYTVWLFGIASSAAAGISAEREEDTWISLIGTTLDDWEILKGKALGALWRRRGVGLTLHFLWLLGLVAGAIHPLGYLQAIVAFLVFTLFALALGTFFSIRSKSTTRATVATLGVLFLLNGGYMLCLFPLASSMDALFFAPCTPHVIANAPMRYSWMQTLFGSYRDQNIQLDIVATHNLTWMLSVVGYGVGTIVVGWSAVLGFERLVDRPRRARRSFGLPNAAVEFDPVDTSEDSVATRTSS